MKKKKIKKNRPVLTSLIFVTIIVGMTNMTERQMFRTVMANTFWLELLFRNGFTIPLYLSSEIIRINPKAIIAVALIME